jgi:hypothetical protein
MDIKVIKEVASMILGFPKVRLRDHFLNVRCSRCPHSPSRHGLMSPSRAFPIPSVRDFF